MQGHNENKYDTYPFQAWIESPLFPIGFVLGFLTGFIIGLGKNGKFD